MSMDEFFRYVATSLVPVLLIIAVSYLMGRMDEARAERRRRERERRNPLGVRSASDRSIIRGL